MSAAQSSKQRQPVNAGTQSAGSYTVLARRYRSRDFDEIIGQEPIARTLKNAIAGNRTAHAYLFCGTRGVGKTSMARIFAKALNVTPDLGESEAIAQAVLRGEDLDVIEIDGASNRGVQEARDLIAAAGLSPARCRYRIYIIDEVHMLTKEAFNTLLKTMEEPPSHVKFILCTTDPHKVPATIQSRCQRFDFRPIPTSEIASHLREILEQERVEAEDAVIHQVARLGNGSMRDALSLLDRLLAAGEEKLTIRLAEELLALPDLSLVASLVHVMLEGDVAKVLNSGAAMLAHGMSIEQAFDALTEYLRNLLVIVSCGEDSELIDLPADVRDAAAAQAKQFDVEGLVHLIALSDSMQKNAAGSACARALFDAAIARMCLSEHLADVSSLLASAGASTEAPSAKKKSVASEPSRAIETNPAVDSARPDESPVESVVEVKPPGGQGSRTADDQLWHTVLEAAAASPRDHARVQDLVLDSFDGSTLRLAVHERGTDRARYLMTQSDSIAAFVERVTGRAVRVVVESTQPASERDQPSSERDHEEAMRHPIVRSACEVFDATVMSVKPRDSHAGRSRNHGGTHV